MKRIDERKTPILILWITVLLIGVVIVSLGYIDFKKEIRDAEALFEAHVDSVVLLINESTREATASTSLIYEIAEVHLVTVAELMKDAAKTNAETWPHLKGAHQMAVWLSSDDNRQFVGDWGKIPNSERAGFLQWMKNADTEFLVDDGPLRALALACIRLETKAHTEDIICRDANELTRHRKEVGIGPFLKGITRKDIRYVALQDSDDILAVSPSPALLSRFDEDPFLIDTLKHSNSERRSFRTRTVNGTTIFEGVVPFELADESIVLLRVGIDGAKLLEVKQNAMSRFLITIGWTVAGILFATLLFVLLKRWQRKKFELNQRLSKEADARRHWEDIGHMAATVAHEVRNPLNTIGMVSQRLKAEFSIPPDEKDAFEDMVQLMISEGHRVERVVTDFLALGKPLKLEYEPNYIDQLLDEGLLPLMMRAEKENKHLELAQSIHAEIVVDTKQFRQMLINLVENALDAVEPGGRVTVSAHDAESQIDIRIRDNGKGLSPDELMMVFKPFVSFKSNGNGLGLALVRRMIDAHGGAIDLSPNAGPGLTATLSFPKRIV